MFEAGHLSYTPGGLVANVDINFGIEGEENIDTGTEFDESHVPVNRGFVARLGIGDYAAGNRPGNLSGNDNLPVAGADDDSRPLVFSAGLGKVGRHETTRMMFHFKNFPVNRKPVGMDVEDGHEHRELAAAAFQNFRLENFFKGHHCAVHA